MCAEKYSVHSKAHLSLVATIRNRPSILHTELAPPCPEGCRSAEHSKFIKRQARKFNHHGCRMRKLLSAIPVQINALQQIIHEYLDVRAINTQKIDEILGNGCTFNISCRKKPGLSIKIAPTEGPNYNIYLRTLSLRRRELGESPIIIIDYGATAMGIWEFIIYQSQLPEMSEIWQFPSCRYLDGDARPEGARSMYANFKDLFPLFLAAVRDSLRAEVGLVSVVLPPASRVATCPQESA